MWCQQKSSYPNFGRYPNSRTIPIIERLLEPDIAASLFGSFEPQRFADFLRDMDTKCFQMFRFQGWQSGEWTRPVWRFLKKYPPEQEASGADD